MYMPAVLKKFLIALIYFVSSILAGVAGYMIIEGYNPVDALYMTVITISTVGFREVHPLSNAGKIFTAVYIIFNLVFFAYLVSTVAQYIFEGELNVIFRRIMTSREVSRLKNHIILCGFGRNGRRAAMELSNSKKRFVVIEKEEISLEKYPGADKKFNFIIGDATQDEVLKMAGIERANTIITTLPKDSENVFITLTARELNPEIKIISRASDENVEKKLHRAGADYVVMPDALGGYHMANIVTKPFIVEFVELLSGFGESDFVLEEVSYLDMKQDYRDLPLSEMNIRKRSGVTVIGFKNHARGFIFNPEPQTVFTNRDVMIILGKEKSIHEFKKIYTRHFKLNEA